MTDEQKPKIENLEQQEADELTPQQAEQAQGGIGEQYGARVAETRYLQVELENT